MIASLLSQAVSLLLWVAALGVAWWAIGRRRQLPVALRLPGFVATLPLAFILRGLLGEASFALPVMAWYAASETVPTREARRLLVVIVASASALYASALGFLHTDVYAIGYGPSFGLAVVAAAVLAAYCWMPALGWCWLLGLALYAARLHPSPNIWDTFIDLPAVLLATYVLIRAAAPRRLRAPADGGAAGCS